MPAAVAIATTAASRVAYRICDVARMTLISERRILDACRNGELDHIHAGGRRLMTQTQIDAMLAKYSTGVTAAAAAEATDELEQARQATRRNAARRGARHRV